MSDLGNPTAQYPMIDEDDFPAAMPSRPRRRLLTVWSAGLVALLLGTVGFYVGVRVQKASGGGSTSSLGAAFTAGSGGLTARAGGMSSTARRSFSGGSSSAGFSGGFPGGSGSGHEVSGEVSSRAGDTLYVEESGGNIVKVKLSGSTTVTKTESVSASKIYPGEEVVVSGEKGSASGTVTALSVSDTGASSSSSAGATGSSTSSTSVSGSGSGAVSSLFGG